ncbi:MAG: ChaN family lipoprotein [Betaproteobacteria bacterium]|nr:ChaN family lipoprotein [Betaproteobacteria bacterium]MDH5350421.1 ChaN family lipoprotein [Betaproteobacteria bacterium]
MSWLLAAARVCAPLALVACATPPHPLEGRIYDARSAAFVGRAALLDEAAATPYVLLGERHDNAGHHRLQREIVEGMLARGARPALAFEQFDREHQAALARAQAAPGRDAESVAAAGKLDRDAWRWPDYAPLVTLALEHGLPIVAANLSRAEARAIVRDPARSGLAAPDAPVRAALERDIVEGHCGQRPERLEGMVEAQRARDAALARALAAHPAAVLITGSGHARRDRGVPLYLPAAARVLSVAFVEVDDEQRAPQDYAGVASYDYAWFTARAARKDPCAGLRLR